MSQAMNIVFLMADQWRWDTFQPGHPCQTPHFDALAQQSVVFDHAFTCYPLCCPARGSLFTGLWPHQTGLMDNIGTMSYYPEGQLHIGHKTYLEHLRDDAGYATSFAGKWHMGNGSAITRRLTSLRATDGAFAPQSTIVALEGGLNPYYESYEEGVGRDQQAIEAGMEQIRDLSGRGQPFCSVISTWGPHFAHQAPQRFAQMYADYAAEQGNAFRPDNWCAPFLEEHKPRMQSKPLWPCQNTRPLSGEDWRRTVASYWAFCSFLDEQFGRVIALLDELGIADNTILAFACDHGEMLGAHGNFDKGPYFYEEIMHIPMIIRDPRCRAPRSRQSYVNLRDLWPTLIDLAGAGDTLREDERERSYWVTEHDATFYCYDAYHGRELKLRGIRTERWKYNWSPHDLGELYDLANDPGERINRIDRLEHADIQQALHARLMAWMVSERDYLLHAEHLLPSGAYVDGRAWEDQHDPGWSERDRAWLAAQGPEDIA